MSDLDYLMGVVERQSRRIDTKPVNRWATVITTMPLTIQLDGDPAPLLGTPASAAPKILMPGERVRVEIQNNRATVLAVANRVHDLRGTTAQRLALEAAGAVVGGMRFYDVTDNCEYMWVGEWRIVGGVSPFTSLTVNSGSGMCQWRRVGDLIHFQFDVTRSSSMSGDFMWDPLCTLPPEARPATIIAISAWGGSVRLASSAVRSDGTVTWRQQSSTSTDRAVGEGLWPSI